MSGPRGSECPGWDPWTTFRDGRGTTFLLVEQSAQIALGIGNDDVRQIYLGLSEAGRRKSFREVKLYKRRKRRVL